MVPPSVLMAAVPWLMAPAELSTLMWPVPLDTLAFTARLPVLVDSSTLPLPLALTALLTVKFPAAASTTSPPLAVELKPATVAVDDAGVVATTSPVASMRLPLMVRLPTVIASASLRNTPVPAWAARVVTLISRASELLPTRWLLGVDRIRPADVMFKVVLLLSSILPPSVLTNTLPLPELMLPSLMKPVVAACRTTLPGVVAALVLMEAPVL